MRFFSGKKIRFFSFGASLTFHSLLILGGSFASPTNPSTRSASSQPLFLELNLVSHIRNEIQTANRMLKQIQKLKTPPLETLAVKTSLQTSVSLPEPKERISRKINLIRKKLYTSIKHQSGAKNLGVQGFQVVSGEESKPEWDSYLIAVRQKVLQFWYPRVAQAGERLVKSEARLDFVVSKNGNVREYNISEWSGSQEFKELSLEAFKQALPFGPLPGGKWQTDKREEFLLSLFFYYQ